MLKEIIHSYINMLKDGQGIDSGMYFATEEQAKFTANHPINKGRFKIIAQHQEMRDYRCDSCLEEGKLSSAMPHNPTGKDLCSDHIREYNESIK